MVNSGSVLFREGAPLPNDLELQSVSFVPGWKLVMSPNAKALKKEMRKRDWHYSGIGDEAQATAFGFTHTSALHQALRRALGRIEGEFNAAEVIAVQHRPWNNLHCVSVTVQPRHVQQSAFSLQQERRLDRNQQGQGFGGAMPAFAA